MSLTQVHITQLSRMPEFGIVNSNTLDLDTNCKVGKKKGLVYTGLFFILL
jgi:hypothetical protein